MEVFCGTSGWAYSWNPDGFDWFVKNSGLNAVELNASFYRFPFPNQVKAWARKTKKFNPKLRWSIKVNRFITHVFKFSEKALVTWNKFKKLFKPLEENIDFFLFQLPPSVTPSVALRIEKFSKKAKLKEKFALEWRNVKWFQEEWKKWCKELGMTLVSVDAPSFTELPRNIYCVNGIVYLRMHGRTGWYSHYYTNEELEEIKEKIVEKNPRKVYIFFNNDTNMRENALRMLKILRRKNVK